MRLTLHTKRKRKWYKKYSENATSPKKYKKTWAIGAPAYRRKGRGFNESITKNEAKKSKLK